MDHDEHFRPPSNRDRQRYYDDSDDLVERIRRAKEAAQRKIEEFGDRSEYTVTKIYGKRTDIDYSKPPKDDEPAPTTQANEQPSVQGSSDNSRKQAERQTSLDLRFDKEAEN